jgi:RNA polymerase sigma-70 factor (ECF subfamily)
LTEEDLLMIYRETIEPLYGYVSRRCGGDRELAEDITQETWLRAVREWHRKGRPARPLAWLTTVAANLLLNEFRRRKPVHIDAVDPSQIMNAMDNGGIYESVDVAALVSLAIARLPNAQGRLIEAFHYQKQPVARIAETLGVSERAAEGRLRRARENLRKELQQAMKDQGDLR